MHLQALTDHDRGALGDRAVECTTLAKGLSSKLQKLCGFCEAVLPTADVPECLLLLFRSKYPDALHSKLPGLLDMLMAL